MDTFKISRRELYILPTRTGWYFALILAALFGIAVKFDNQAAFMMLFMLAAVGLVAMIYTHNNVVNLQLSAHSSSPVFVGEVARFPVTITNPSNKPRHSVWFVCAGFHQVMTIDKSGSETITAELPTLQRGYYVCEPIILSSQFPIGVLFCWSKRFISGQRCLVYPQPLDLVPLTEDGSAAGKQETNQVVITGNEDYRGMKAYQAGDRIRDIHWPSVAKTQRLVTLEYENQSFASQNLSWFALPNNMPVEDKLSQLCFWVMQAERQKVRYQLELPGNTIEFDTGNTHYHECLRTLALWGLETEPTSSKEKEISS